MSPLKNLLALLLVVIIVYCNLGCGNEPPVSKATGSNTPDNTTYQPKEYVQLMHPEWSKNATIYEVNLRQYTPEGTFAAFEKHLPRLKALGVDILWLMPVHPIGEKNRK